MVHLNDLVALPAVSLRGGILHILDSLILRNDVGNGKERGLQNRVDAAAQSDLLAELYTIDRVEIDLVIGNILFHLCGQMLVEFLLIPFAVKQEIPAGLQILHHVVDIDIRGFVAGHEIRLCNVIGGLNRLVAKTQMRNGQAAGFFGIVGKIALRIHIGMVADNFDGVLVCADGSVRAKAPEFAGMCTGRCGVRIFCNLQRKVRHIVIDADREALLRRRRLHVAVNGDNLARVGIFRTEAVASGVNRQRTEFSILQTRDNVEVQRFTNGTALFRAVQHADLLHGLRKNGGQIFRNKRTVQMDFHKTDLITLGVQVIHYFFRAFAYGAHGDNNFRRVRRAVVVERLIVRADLGVDLVHAADNDFRECVIVAVAGFVDLEKQVVVL